MKKTLRLKKNQSLPENLFSEDLTALEIFGDSFTELSAQFAVFHHMESLSVVSKSLKSIDSEIFTLPQLKQLKIKHGELTNLPQVNHPSSIKTLFITDTELAEIPESIYLLEQLEILVLSGNNLTTLPKNIQLLKNLRRLVLDQNDITHLHLERASFPRLNHLSLDGNPLSEDSKQNLYTEFGIQL